jgi:hypothetical protein
MGSVRPGVAVLFLIAVECYAQPATRIDGVHALNPGSALVWADTGAPHIWRVEFSGVSANAPIRRTAIPTPPELKLFKDRSRQERSPQAHVNFGPDGTLRIFWVDNEREFGEAHFKFDLHQAESADEGRTWRMYRSTLPEPGGGASQVGQCRFVDRQHGWMLLFGGPGGGQLPEMLATTADGGRTWKTVADSDQQGAGNAPLGRNGGQSFVIRSATIAAFVAARNSEKELPLGAAWTADGGHTWLNTPISQESSWVGYNVGELAQLKDDPIHPHRVCVDALLNRYDQSSDSYSSGDARYCSADDGRTWLSPVRVPMPTTIIGDTGPGRGHGSSIPVYADATLGFAKVWGDRKALGREYALFVTTDAGKTWNPAPAPMAQRYRASEDIQMTQVDAQGNTVWLLLTLAGDSPHSDLFVSCDHGVTWRFVPAAGR